MNLVMEPVHLAVLSLMGRSNVFARLVLSFPYQEGPNVLVCQMLVHD